MSGGKCSLWRVSFSAAEKRLMQCATDATGQLCRKEVFKLLKEDIEDFKNDSEVGGHLDFGSFELKNIFLKLLDDQPADEFWRQDNLHICYSWALFKVSQCLMEEHVPHYFISSVNVLKKIVSKAKYRAFIAYLDRKQEIYSSGRRLISRRNWDLFMWLNYQTKTPLNSKKYT